MSELRKQKQAAIEAVARHFSATWEGGEEPADAYVTIAAKRVAVEVVTIKRVGNRRGDAKPRLRFDRVALRLVGGLQAALHGSVPDGKTVLVTITAPIRLAAKTAAALEEQIRSHLAHRSAQREVKYRIHGNHVRVRFVEGGSRAAAEVIGFVHNPDSDPNGFLDRTQSLLERIHARGAKGAPLKPALDRWLVVADENGQSHVGTYRYVLPQLSIATDFKKTLVVLAGGRIELLTC